MIVPMLAGLMEVSMDRMWTFDQFFNTVSQFDDMIRLKFFVCCMAEHVPIYVHKMDS